MKIQFIFLLFLANICKAQEWQVEFMAGASGYNGDLTQKRINLNELRPALNLNCKYNTGDFINFRVGFAYGRVGADDKNNPSPNLKARNLSFKTDIFELNAMAEINFLDPESYTAYPYFMAGVGVFHFNPFTYDDANKKVYLQPLSTEGEGLKEYPERKKYALTQVCFPVGMGWKMPLNEKWDLSIEFGYRFLFTDYLDDVSKGYVDLNVLASEKGPEAAALSYRGTGPLRPADVRGNPTSNDSYFFGGLKFSTDLSNIFGYKGN